MLLAHWLKSLCPFLTAQSMQRKARRSRGWRYKALATAVERLEKRIVLDGSNPPVMNTIIDQRGYEGQTVALQTSANDPGYDDTLTYDFSGLPNTFSIDPDTGLITGIFESSSSGGYEVIVSVDDGEGGTDSESFTWIVTTTPNSPPVFESSTSTVASDPDGDSLTYRETTQYIVTTYGALERGSTTTTIVAFDGHGNSASNEIVSGYYNTAPVFADVGSGWGITGNDKLLQVLASDPDNDAITYSFYETPPTGMTIDPDTGTIYVNSVPDGLSGITVVATDSYGGSSTTTINLNTGSGYNGTPSISSPGSPYSQTGADIELQMEADDEEEGELIYSASGLPWGLTIDSSTGLISGHIDESHVSTAIYGGAVYNVIVSVHDDAGNADIVEFQWYVIGGDFLLNDIPDQIGYVGQSSHLILTAIGGRPSLTTTYEIDGLPQQGWTPLNYAYLSSNTFELQGTVDDTLGTVTFTTGSGPFTRSFNWTVNSLPNFSPNVSNPGTQVTYEGEQISLFIDAYDADGNALTYAAVNLPPGLSIDVETGEISGTLEYDAYEISTAGYEVMVVVDDGHGVSGVVNFFWPVLSNEPPEITEPDPQSNAEGEEIEPLMILATDVDDFTVTVDGLPDYLDFNPATGEISGTVGYDAAESSNVTYQVTVTAEDEHGAISIVHFDWTIIPNEPPEVENPGPRSNAEGQTVSLTIEASDPDDDDLTFSAVGLPEGLDIHPVTGVIGPSASYYAAQISDGDYDVTVTVTDEHGDSTDVNFTWTITDVNRVPQITSPGNRGNTEGNAVNLQIVASDPDSYDNDNLTYSATGLPGNLSIHPTTGVIGSAIASGAATTNGGTYAVTVYVTDGTDTASVQFSWYVILAVTDSANGLLVYGSPATVSVLANDRIQSANPVTLTIANSPAHGTATVTGSGTTITYTPGSTHYATDSLTYRIADQYGGISYGTVNIGYTNRTPTPQPDEATARTNGGVVSISVLTNDFDPDGDQLTLDNSYTITPAHGTASVSGSTIQYTPTTDYVGPDSFTYKVLDGFGGYATTTVYVDVAGNHDPVAVNDTRIETSANGQITISVLTNDSDPENDTLTVDSVTTPHNGGTASITGSGTTIAFTPNANGDSDWFSYTISDGHGGFATAIVTIVYLTEATPVKSVSVLNLTDGIVLFPEPENEEDAEFYEQQVGDYHLDLRAQVVGGTVTSYSWDLSAAMDAEDVTVTNTANLSLNWDPYPESYEQVIALTVTFSDNTTITQEYEFYVDGRHTAVAQPTSLNTWPIVATPDLLLANEAKIESQYYSVSLASGELSVEHALPVYNPGTSPIVLSYSSTAADLRPIFINHYTISPTLGVPPTIRAKLTLNGVAGTPVYFDTSDFHAGDVLQIALQADATALATGRYEYQFEIIANYQSPATITDIGYVSLINSKNSYFGSGWSIDGIHRIHTGTGGVILELDDGKSLWYAAGTGGSFFRPYGDFSTLVQNGNGTYTLTSKEGIQTNFNSSGLQTSVVDRNGNTTTFTYTNGKLTSITDSVDLETTFTYTNGKVSTITDPADRETQLTYYLAGQLKSITDADDAKYSYIYDTSGRMKSLTNPRNYSTDFAYNPHGRIAAVYRPDESVEQYTAWQTVGLPFPSTATSLNPALPVLATDATAIYVDPRNHVWQSRLDWTGFGLVTESTDPHGYTKVTHYTRDGLPWLTADEMSRRTRIDYNSQGNPTRLILPGTDDIEYDNINIRKQTYTYDSSSFSQPLTSTDPLGYTTEYDYDTHGNLEMITLPDMNEDPEDNPTTIYDYDTAGNLISETNARGFTTTYHYDTRNRLDKITYPDDDTNENNNPEVTFTYYADGTLESRTNERDFTTVYDFDPMGRLKSTTLPDDDTNPNNNPVYGYDYDDAGNLTELIDPYEKTTTYGYDPMNRLESVTDPLNHATTYEYDANGNVRFVNEPIKTTEYIYDELNRVISIGDPTLLEYNPAGQVTKVTEPDPDGEGPATGAVTEFEHNNAGFISVVRDPNGTENRFKSDAKGNRNELGNYGISVSPCCYIFYDAQGRIIATENHRTQTGTEIAFDSVGNEKEVLGPDPDGEGDNQPRPLIVNTFTATNQLLTTTDATGHVTTYDYDDAGNLISVTASPPTLYTYDAQNRLRIVTDPEGGETEYTYDLAGRLATITDPEDNTTEYEYDDAGRLILRTDPLGHETTYGYNDNNWLTSVTDRNGRKIVYVYDDHGNREKEQWLDSEEEIIWEITYDYDLADRLISASDGNSTYEYTYDNANRIETIDNTGTPGLPDYIMEFTYNGLDNRLTADDSLGGHIDYDYLDGKIPLSIDLEDTMSGAYAEVEFETDFADRLMNITRTGSNTLVAEPPDQPFTVFTYDTANRINDIVHSVDEEATELSAFHYTYTLDGFLDTYSGPEGDFEYDYDDTHQLTEVTGDRTESYNYDANGNRTMQGYETDDNNRLEESPTHTYEYDFEGNRIRMTNKATDEVTEYEWDYRNRLTRVVVRDDENNIIRELRNTYDVFDRRIGRWYDANGEVSGGIEETWSAYDGPNTYADFDENGDLTVRYLYGQAVDQIFARIAADGDIDWYLTDNLGSVRQLVNLDGSLRDDITYDSYGNILNETEPENGDRFKFTAREWEAAVDLQFSRTRWYDPDAGRFINDDTIGFESGDSNLQRYVNNSPTNFTDPFGTQLVKVTTTTYHDASGVLVPDTKTEFIYVPDATPLRSGDKLGDNTTVERLTDDEARLAALARGKPQLEKDVATILNLANDTFVRPNINLLGLNHWFFPNLSSYCARWGSAFLYKLYDDRTLTTSDIKIGGYGLLYPAAGGPDHFVVLIQLPGSNDVYVLDSFGLDNNQDHIFNTNELNGRTDVPEETKSDLKAAIDNFRNRPFPP